MDPYENPHGECLKNLKLTIRKDGLAQTISALNEAWADKRTYLEYEPPKVYDNNGKEILGARDHWLNLVRSIISDLKWLLHLKFYKFWSNVLYNSTISECLVSCLQELPTFYNWETFPDDPEMQEFLESLRHKVFLVLARLVTSKETKEEFLSRQAHADILYNNFLLTVPMMLDICQLYGRENPRDVKKMLMTVMKLQPSYENDLQEAAYFFIQDFKNVENQLENRPTLLASGGLSLSEGALNQLFTLEYLEDLIIHLLDVASNISVFLDCYPPARRFLSTENFINEMVHLYGNTIPEMYKRLDPLTYEDQTVVKYMELKHRLDVTRVELIKIFRSTTYHKITSILEAPDPSSVPDASTDIEQFLDFLAEATTEPEFMNDYLASYPIGIDFEIISQINPHVLTKKVEYMELVELDRRKECELPRPSNMPTPEATPSTSQQTEPNRVQDESTKDKPPKKTEAELAILIKNVKDILSDLGEGFIERCLVHYNYDVSNVINAIFEDSLPENLKSIDRSLPYIPPDPEEMAAANDNLLGSERLNVFDNDEFDVMTRDTIDQSRVHKGKRKDKYKNFGELLDDKSCRNEKRAMYEQYSMVQDEYDDEYDDTYDGHDIGSRGVGEPSEMDGRAFTTPRVLRWNEKREADDEDEGENEVEVGDGPSTSQNDRLNFVQDPAELRARAEQRRFSKRGGAGGNRSSDLIGKPKGQGNDKNVLINRDRKNTNKASRANHNRRTGADYKRRQGMVP